MYYVTPTTCHFEKGKTMEIVKKSLVARGDKDPQAEHGLILRQWNYSVWYYNGGYMSL